MFSVIKCLSYCFCYEEIAFQCPCYGKKNKSVQSINLAIMKWCPNILWKKEQWPISGFGKRFEPGQGNNAYIFPGASLGIITAGIRHIQVTIYLGIDTGGISNFRWTHTLLTTSLLASGIFRGHIHSWNHYMWHHAYQMKTSSPGIIIL